MPPRRISLAALSLLIGCTRPADESASAATASSAADPQLRILLVVAERGFVAAFPGLSVRPRDDLGVAETTLGPAHTFFYHEEEAGASFAVTVIEYPDAASEDEIVKVLRSDALAVPAGQLVAAGRTRVRKHTSEHADNGSVDADYVAVDVDGSHLFRTSCVFGKRAYLLEVSGPRASRELNDMFVRAFRVAP